MTAPTSPWSFDRRPDFELTMPSNGRGNSVVPGSVCSGKTKLPSMTTQAPAQADHSHTGPGRDSAPRTAQPD